MSCVITYITLFMPPFSFIRRGQTRHGLPNYTLTTNSSYIILFVVMNVQSLETTFKYKFNHVKFTLQNKKNMMSKLVVKERLYNLNLVICARLINEKGKSII
jgi:hypothetical protein